MGHLAGKENLHPVSSTVLAWPRDSDDVRNLVQENRQDALRLIIGQEPIDSFTHQVEVEDFAEGHDSLPDVPVSFATEYRLFSSRRVRTIQRK